MPVSDICSRGLVTVESGSTVQFAANQMKSAHVGAVVVIARDNDSVKPIGILTDRDIVLNIVSENRDPDVARVDDIMSKDIITIDADAGVSDAIKLMQKQKVRRLLVLDKHQNLRGILTADDLLQLLGDEVHGLGALVQKQVWSEEAPEDQVDRNFVP